jgi:hypothetical protein
LAESQEGCAGGRLLAEPNISVAHPATSIGGRLASVIDDTTSLELLRGA